ncbi:putative aliphatic amidase expression-regulating protein [Octadecabacter antarcticus 307]|uniref:Putative aliphatic amidase expression-regulating protein n=1 Tax=Octadecabacter antarcticus 307 TaxID=391626 RepID=M9R717_9RHOB|nr:transporter substrate-binding domain-containing protein [Octadecabacter antarcticus]AGI67558.1 putative aliphatic amidase expression-regulating protein [Octadecabacter antarcticus 307]
MRFEVNLSKTEINIGIMFSTSGNYAAVGMSMFAGAQLAISEINADVSLPVQLTPVVINPGGVASAYTHAAQTLLSKHKVTHVFGCYTSSSRKDVLPIFEKYDGLLWYPSHYEGFETSDNVIYTGAAPNQHILPMARHLLDHHGSRGWFVGSNYVWAWENNRILREALVEVGGTVIGERYFPIGELNLDALAQQIIEDRPDFIFNTLIGKSSYAFLNSLRTAAVAAGIDQPSSMPVASCSLSEAELPLIGASAAGHLSSSVYFSTINSPENNRFVRAWNRQFSHLGQACADAEATYTAVHLLAHAILRGGDTSFLTVHEAVRGLQFHAPQGLVTVDPDNLHCAMRPLIGRSTAAGTFDIIHSDCGPVRPDPYLVWSSLDNARAARNGSFVRAVQ